MTHHDLSGKMKFNPSFFTKPVAPQNIELKPGSTTATEVNKNTEEIKKTNLLQVLGYTSKVLFWGVCTAFIIVLLLTIFK